MRSLSIYSQKDRKEFSNPTTLFNEDLKEIIMKIWMNRDFLNAADLNELTFFYKKGFFEK